MNRIFQAFVEGLAAGTDVKDLRAVLAKASEALDLTCFAYLVLPTQRGMLPQLISTYPTTWTDHYIDQHYERLDPVITQALRTDDPFEWGDEVSMDLSLQQQSLFAEAAAFGIRCGFTIPIHDSRGPIAAVTFATDQRRPSFQRCVAERGLALQLMALYFHAHARQRLAPARIVDGIQLSPREFECLEWTAQGKSAWEIGRILGISRRTVACHLDNAKAKLGVHSNYQAVARLVASSAYPK